MRYYLKVWDVVDEGPTEYGPFETYKEAHDFIHENEDWEIYQK